MGACKIGYLKKSEIRIALLQEEETYYYPCPCGDRFAITKEELQCGEEVATCPSCSLIIKVINDFLP